MQVTIVKMNLPLTQTTTYPRWFVEARKDGDRCVYDLGNYATEAEAIEAKNAAEAK